MYPAVLTPDEQKERLQYTAVLKDLPPNVKAIDLGRIYSEVKAVSIGIPRYSGSYKSKPWAYFAFKTPELRDAAMELSCSLRNRRLTWILPDAVKDLCVRCGSAAHKTKDCDTFADRGRKPIPKSIQLNYDRYKPVGYVKPRSLPDQKKKPQSRSRSRSRSKPRTSSSANNSSHSDSDRHVSYAEAAASDSLNESAHSPQNRSGSSSSPSFASSSKSSTPSNSSKNKGKDVLKQPPVIDNAARDAIRKITDQLADAFSGSN